MKNILEFIGTVIGLIADYVSIKKEEIKAEYIVFGILITGGLLILNNINAKDEEAIPTGNNISVVNNGVQQGDNIVADQIIIENHTEKEYENELKGNLIWFEEYSFSLNKGIPYRAPHAFQTKHQLSLSLSNSNDIAVQINRLNLEVLSFEKCEDSNVYISSPDGLGSFEPQFYYGKITNTYTSNSMYYQGNYQDIVQKGVEAKPQNRYLKIAANDSELLTILFECMETGIYNISIQVEYSINGKEEVFKLEPLELFLLSTQDHTDFMNRQHNLYRGDTFWFFQIENYINNHSPIPDWYMQAIDSGVEAYEICRNYEEFPFMYFTIKNWEEYIAIHYACYDLETNNLDIIKYLQILNTNNNIEDNYMEKLNKTCESPVRQVNTDMRRILNGAEKPLPWQKTESYYYDVYCIPPCFVYNESPYAKIETVNQSSNGKVSLTGYATDKLKGQRNFKAIIRPVPDTEYDYYLENIFYN